MDNVFKALPTRPAESYSTGFTPTTGKLWGRCANTLDMTRQAVTKHLVLLEDANLVVDGWQGP